MAKGLREAVGSAVAAGDLTWNRSGEEAPVDRIVASAWTGTNLGRLLWRLKYAKDRSTFNLRTALWLVVDRSVRKRKIFGKEKPSDQLIATCAAALDEWMNDECGACNATGWIRRGALPKRCTDCVEGRREWTVGDRQTKLEGVYDALLYRRVLTRLQEADNRQRNETQRRRG